MEDNKKSKEKNKNLLSDTENITNGNGVEILCPYFWHSGRRCEKPEVTQQEITGVIRSWKIGKQQVKMLNMNNELIKYGCPAL